MPPGIGVIVFNAVGVPTCEHSIFRQVAFLNEERRLSFLNEPKPKSQIFEVGGQEPFTASCWKVLLLCSLCNLDRQESFQLALVLKSVLVPSFDRMSAPNSPPEASVRSGFG